jgi:hypothetical protein
MTPNDLFSFLTTHNYNATPKDDSVQVKIDGTFNKAVSNGAHRGLARSNDYDLGSREIVSSSKSPSRSSFYEA